MNQIAFFALILWLPAVFVLFEKYSVTKSIVVSFVAAWLFLPPTLIILPGVPDWSKTSATVFSVLLCLYLKQPGKLLAVKPRWFDVPVLAFCSIPFAASIHNGMGPYDGLSACLEELFRWGFPYLIGRAYLGTPTGNRQLCLGIAMGGIIYVPFCLFEIRMSPQIKAWIYGHGEGRAIDFGLRYGGYRPMVFLSTGLELGWWMCCASLAAFMLWKSDNVRRLWGYPMWALTAALGLVTVACKATGALLQIALGFGLIYASRSLKRSVLVWVLLAIGPCYCVSRIMGVWTGEAAVSWVSSIFGADRAESLSFRFANEEILIQSAMQRPVFGWSRAGGFNLPNEFGLSAVTDGFWTIVFGWMGISGLIALNGMLLVPTALFLRRYNPRTWFEPPVAPMAVHALLLPLFMVDNLSNAMLNPIYAIAMGALAGGVTYRGPDDLVAGLPAREALAALRDPDLMPAVIAPPAPRGGSPRDRAADHHEQEAANAAALARWSEALARSEDAIRARLAAADTGRSDDRIDRLARTYVFHARIQALSGNPQGAAHVREQARSEWAGLEAIGRLDAAAAAAHAANLNDLAWGLVRVAEARDRDPERYNRAIQLAEEALRIDPERACFWNTLGLAYLRRNDHHRAIHALGQSVALSDDGGSAHDFYYLALANLALGYRGPAAEWQRRADALLIAEPARDSDLEAARQEVARLMHGMGTLRPDKNPRGSVQKRD